jgi:hypothetical protein
MKMKTLLALFSIAALAIAETPPTYPPEKHANTLAKRRQ